MYQDSGTVGRCHAPIILTEIAKKSGGLFDRYSVPIQGDRTTPRAFASLCSRVADPIVRITIDGIKSLDSPAAAQKSIAPKTNLRAHTR